MRKRIKPSIIKQKQKIQQRLDKVRKIKENKEPKDKRNKWEKQYDK